MEKQFNALQIKAIEASGGHFLVLAPPGCGKTDILAERVARAHQSGVAFSDMLCLTFTNRASRGMRDRVRDRIGADASGIFVGNIHRLCSKLLFDKNLIPANTSIIDEDDQADILIGLDGVDRFKLKRGANQGEPDRVLVGLVTEVACHIWQRRQGHPIHTCIGGEVGERCYEIARMSGFDHNRVVNSFEGDPFITRAALQYNDYKRDHDEIDFDDILAMAFEHLRHNDNEDIKRYPWIQVDEVQDLNPLQIAIIDAITLQNENTTVMYLGDEQQAIFSFLGAKLEQLGLLQKRCGNNIINLSTNYRSAKYLLDIFNTYAEKELNVNPAFLPNANNNLTAHEKFDILLARSDSAESEIRRVPDMIRHYLKPEFEGERLALLVATNQTADEISNSLTDKGIDHFKISGKDMFRTKDYRTMAALFTVTANEFNECAWSRLLFGIDAFKLLYDARSFIKSLRDSMMTPFDLLTPQTMLQKFCDLYQNHEIVMFDTETTGLNVLHDDIVQIAAFKVKGGKKVDGSDFNIFLHTDIEIPPMLGDLTNPLVEEFARNPHVDRKEGLRQFLDYVGDCPVLGHNVTYDYQILRNNVARELHEDIQLTTIDTLAVIKRVRPSMRRYKLEFLISTLGLAGKNSHLANEDVEATLHLADFCYREAQAHLADQERILAMPRTQGVVNHLKEVEPIITGILDGIYLPVADTGHTVVDAFKDIYQTMRDLKFCRDLGNKFNYFLAYIHSEWLNADAGETLFDQINNHINDMTSTINEGDLISNDMVVDRVFVMTVHKAKGLEFDNVVVLDAVNDKYPFYRTNINLRSTNPYQRKQGLIERMEDARKFYVAISRAKKRLCVSYSTINAKGFTTSLTPFMNSILPYFTLIGQRS